VSTNPIQRIADLEAQLATALAANETLRANGNGNGHVDVEKLIKQAFDRFGQTFREDYTGKLAGMIQPFIESTVRRCKETEEKQTALESLFKKHEAAVSKSASSTAAAFSQLRADAAADWQAYRAEMQQDITHVEEFARWFLGQMQVSTRENAKAVTSCQGAVKTTQELLKKLDKPVEETSAYLEEVQSHGETVITRASRHLTDAYKNLRQPVLWRATILMVVTIVLHLGVGAFTLWRNRSEIDTNWQDLVQHSEQQKTEIKGLLDKTIEETKESQLDREVKVKMWDAMLNTLTPQQRQAIIEKFRWQVNEAERKRIGDQMGASHDQMEGKRK
jgi:hypothetical protein